MLVNYVPYTTAAYSMLALGILFFGLIANKVLNFDTMGKEEFEIKTD